MAFSSVWERQGYKEINRIALAKRLHWGRTEPIFHSALSVESDDLLSGGIHLTTFNGEETLETPFITEICNGLETKSREIIIVGHSTGFTVVSIVDNAKRKLSDHIMIQQQPG